MSDDPGMLHRFAAMEAPVLVVMGVSGSGKTTVASALAAQLGWPSAEGDDLHPAENRAKMTAGVALDDDDRWPWLARVRDWIVARTKAGEPGIITCSALSAAYRDQLRGPSVIFVHLAGSAAVVSSRHAARENHFMPSSLLASQFTVLEPPDDEEQSISVDIGEPPEAIARRVISSLGLRRICDRRAARGGSRGQSGEGALDRAPLHYPSGNASKS